MYGMVKTTVYLPEELKARVERAAAAQGTSEAEVIRSAIEQFTAPASIPGLAFRSSTPLGIPASPSASMKLWQRASAGIDARPRHERAVQH